MLSGGVAMAYTRPVLCRLCGFPAPDGGVPASQVDREKLSEWCLRVMDIELDQEGLEEAVFCHLCVFDARFEEEHTDSSGCWRKVSRCENTFLENYILGNLDSDVKPCAVQLTILSKKQIKALTYKKPKSRKGEYSCVYCGQRLEAKRHMIQHVKNSHCDLETFFCSECKSYFKSALARTQHLKSHSRNCRYCNKVFFNRFSYKTHITKMHQDYAIRCNFHNCAAFFKTEEERQEHVEEEHTNMKWCIYCNKMVKALGVHIRRNHQDIAISCNYDDKLCNNHFLTQEERLKHILEVHNGEKNSVSHLKCYFCKKLARKTGYLEHVRKCHPSEVVFKCNFHQKCVTYYLTKGERQKHILEKHQSGKDKVKCVYCEKMIIQVFLSDHLRVNHKSRAIKCDSPSKEGCRSYFQTQTEKEEHLRKKHQNVKMGAICSYCNKTFMDKPHLGRHIIRVHSDIKWKNATLNLKCPKCSIMFKTDYFLGRHIKSVHKQSEKCQFCNENTSSMHSHAVRSICKFCNKEVACKGLSKKHLQKCIEKPKCSQCGITFTNYAGLWSHFKSETHKQNSAS